jgi:hypothetical protein
MYFKCYRMYYWESLYLLLKTLYRKYIQGFKSIFCLEKLVGIFLKGVRIIIIKII